MSVTETNVIDQIGISKEDEINLIISDHLEWGDNTNNHLYTLQEKINSYISFIESEEIFEVYPKSQGKKSKLRFILNIFHAVRMLRDF